MSIKPGYIRVSQILSQWDRFSHVKEDVLKKKTELGTNVHEAISAHMDDFSLPLEKGKEYIESFLKWQKETNFEIIYKSTRFYCDFLKITGEVDAIGRFPESKQLILVDFKTSASIDKTYWPLQGQFYHYLCKVNEIKISPSILFLQLNKEGKMPKAEEFKASDNLMNVCMSAYVCYKYINHLD